MALDNTYFYGNLAIAQVTEHSVSDNLMWFIKDYEVEFLKLLLGEALYAEYVAGVLLAGPNKWTVLRDKIYIADDPLKQSPAANYVYFFFQQNEATNTVGVGESKVKSENAVPVSNAVKSKLVWNKMVDMNLSIKAFIEANMADYGSYVKPTYSADPALNEVYKQRRGILKRTTVFF
jgi:hypothetical protein